MQIPRKVTKSCKSLNISKPLQMLECIDQVYISTWYWIIVHASYQKKCRMKHFSRMRRFETWLLSALSNTWHVSFVAYKKLFWSLPARFLLPSCKTQWSNWCMWTVSSDVGLSSFVFLLKVFDYALYLISIYVLLQISLPIAPKPTKPYMWRSKYLGWF